MLRGAFNLESGGGGAKEPVSSGSSNNRNRLRSATSVLLSREMGFGMGPVGSLVHAVGGSVVSGVDNHSAYVAAEDLHSFSSAGGEGGGGGGGGRENRDSTASASSFSFKLQSKHALRLFNFNLLN